jgi:hypothetical protein
MNSRIFVFLLAVTISFAGGLLPLVNSRASVSGPEPGDKSGFLIKEASQGSLYQFKVNAEGGLPPLKWRVVGGETPPGIEGNYRPLSTPGSRGSTNDLRFFVGLKADVGETLSKFAPDLTSGQASGSQ